MPSKNPTTSVRLPPPIAHLVKLHAEDEGIAYHAAIVRLVKIGLERITLPVNTPDGPVNLKVTKITPSASAKTATKFRAPSRRRWALDVPVGPPTSPPGSRLKGAKK